MFSMLTLCIKHITNINQDYGIDTDLVSIPRYYILVPASAREKPISVDLKYADLLPKKHFWLLSMLFLQV